MSDDNTLRGMVREAIRGGKLPNRAPDRMWGGAGSGSQCSICGAPVQQREVGYELEFAAGMGVDSSHHIVHAHCFAALEAERRKPGLGGVATSPR